MHIQLKGRLAAMVSVLAVGILGAGCVTTGDVIDQSVAGASDLISGVTAGSLPGSAAAADSAAGGGPGRAGDGTGVQASAEPDLTPEERRMREQSRAFQKTVWQGALIGAGAGALWGLLQGDDTRGVLTKAAIGGAAGGLAGLYVAEKQKEFANQEDQLDAMIADVRQSNAKTEELIASARQVIAEDKRQLAAVQRRYRAGQATQAELAQTRRRIADNQAVIAQASSGAREQYQMFNGAEREFRQQNPGTDTGALQRELETYNQQIETLDGLADSVAVA